jgi:hypothetical protein
LEGWGGDFGGEDAVFYAEDGGAEDAEEERVFGDILDGDWYVLAELSLSLRREV